jgi:hypothetical protein
MLKLLILPLMTAQPSEMLEFLSRLYWYLTGVSKIQARKSLITPYVSTDFSMN